MQWWLPGEDRQTQQLLSTAPASAKRQDVGVRNIEDPLEQPSPTSLALGTGSAEDSFSTDQGLGAGGGFGMIQVHHIYCVLSFYYYYYISSTSDHQALDPEDWGPLF